MKTKKASGPDMIPVEITKIVVDKIHEYVLRVVNNLWKEESFLKYGKKQD